MENNYIHSVKDVLISNIIYTIFSKVINYISVVTLVTQFNNWALSQRNYVYVNQFQVLLKSIVNRLMTNELIQFIFIVIIITYDEIEIHKNIYIFFVSRSHFF